jgi:hypothetical protein
MHSIGNIALLAAPPSRLLPSPRIKPVQQIQDYQNQIEVYPLRAYD